MKNGVMMAHDANSNFEDADNYDIPSTSEDEFLNEAEWIQVDQVINITLIYYLPKISVLKQS